MAGLVGIMFVVCYHCFDWSSLPKVGAALLGKHCRERHRIGHRHKINRTDAVSPYSCLLDCCLKRTANND